MKWVAIRSFRIGSMSASRTAIAISDPEYPSVIRPSCLNSSCVTLCGVSPTFNSNILVRACSSGNGMNIRRSNRRRIALSSCHGIFVAPNTNTPLGSFPTPYPNQMRLEGGRCFAGGLAFIWTRNSVFTRREASLSPSPRVPQMASTSSMKIMEGLFCLAIVNNCFTSLTIRLPVEVRVYRSLSPIHLEIRSLELTEKKVEFASVATAFARNDFPVPGGP